MADPLEIEPDLDAIDEVLDALLRRDASLRFDGERDWLLTAIRADLDRILERPELDDATLDRVIALKDKLRRVRESFARETYSSRLDPGRFRAHQRPAATLPTVLLARTRQARSRRSTSSATRRGPPSPGEDPDPDPPGVAAGPSRRLRRATP